MKWEKLILALVAMLFTAIIFVLLPLEQGKYRLSQEKTSKLFQAHRIFFADMDGDGVKEMVRCKKGDPVPSFNLMHMDMSVIGQWNLEGEWVQTAMVQTTDLDSDGFRELIAFTYHRDSVWINVIEAMQENGISLKIAIDRVSLANGEQDWRIDRGVSAQMNENGPQEFIFTIAAGYSVLPRRLYMLDLEQRKVSASDPLNGSKISHPLVLDLNADGQPEIVVNSNAPGNVSDSSVSRADTCAWLLVFDKDLQVKSANSYAGSPSYLRLQVLEEEGSKYLACLHFSTLEGLDPKSLDIYAWERDSLVRKSSSYLIAKNEVSFINDHVTEKVFRVYDGTEHILSFNKELEETNRIDLSITGTKLNHYLSLDVDGDGSMEQVLFSDFRYITVFTSDFKHPEVFDLGTEEGRPVVSSFLEDGVAKLSVFRWPSHQLISYTRNPLYPMHYGFILLLFLVNYLLFYLLFKWQRVHLEKKRQAEKELLHYQLMNVKQQLDPHFLFNALSGISSYYREDDGDNAQHYIAKVSRLMLYSFENSDSPTVMLKDELRFVENYLEVERLRLGDRIEFLLEVETELQESLMVPKMLVQNFVENALKHGIRHLSERKGVLRISSERINGDLQIHVEDNGIGRAEAVERGSRGTGSGLRMIDRSLEIFASLQGKRITYVIEDLIDASGKGRGTIVHIQIPLKT